VVGQHLQGVGDARAQQFLVHRMGWIVAIGIFEKIFEHGFVMLHNVLIEGNRGPADP
jgi:hypothetical protein